MENIEMTSENFKKMIDEAKNGNLENILEIIKIVKKDFKTIKNNSKNLQMYSPELKKLKKDYFNLQSDFSKYIKSIENYWENVKKIYLPLVEKNEKDMSN